MSTKYYLQKVPVEAVQPGFSLAIPHDGDAPFQVRLRKCASEVASQ